MFNLKKTGLGPDPGTSRRRLGQILVDGGFIAPQDLEAALDQQKRSNHRLGEILVGMGVLSPVDLKAVLSIQKELSSPHDSMKAAAGVRLLLGELFLKAKRIRREQLELALKEQKQTGKKIGEVLLRHGLITEKELDVALSYQRCQRDEMGVPSGLRLGEILVATEQITREQLEDVLKCQKLSQKKIGELLIEAGYVKSHQVEHGLNLQHKLVTAALVAALAMAHVAGVEEAYGGSPPRSSTSAKMNVGARVLEHTSMKVLNQVGQFVVTHADIMRGYVDVPAATRIAVKSNNPAGYLLSFEILSGPSLIFDSISVLVGGREVVLSTGGGWIPQPYTRGGATVDVSYRFSLSKDAQPGTYVWPLAVSVLSR